MECGIYAISSLPDLLFVVFFPSSYAVLCCTTQSKYNVKIRWHAINRQNGRLQKRHFLIKRENERSIDIAYEMPFTSTKPTTAKTMTMTTKKERIDLRSNAATKETHYCNNTRTHPQKEREKNGVRLVKLAYDVLADSSLGFFFLYLGVSLCCCCFYFRVISSDVHSLWNN